MRYLFCMFDYSASKPHINLSNNSDSIKIKTLSQQFDRINSTANNELNRKFEEDDSTRNQ